MYTVKDVMELVWVREEQIGVSERIIIYYTIVDGTSNIFDFFFFIHTRLSFPKTRYIICRHIILTTRIVRVDMGSVDSFFYFFQPIMLYEFLIKPYIILFFISIIITYIM